MTEFFDELNFLTNLSTINFMAMNLMTKNSITTNLTTPNLIIEGNYVDGSYIDQSYDESFDGKRYHDELFYANAPNNHIIFVHFAVLMMTLAGPPIFGLPETDIDSDMPESGQTNYEKQGNAAG
ncbi:hypothetical protein QE152_g310 [Popillia japonica]|uniref:Uncharacterized protein n=1 Tax=Popillia japonica TaxID=7064 RepID=A0AAW1NJN7_POPJA